LEVRQARRNEELPSDFRAPRFVPGLQFSSGEIRPAAGEDAGRKAGENGEILIGACRAAAAGIYLGVDAGCRE